MATLSRSTPMKLARPNAAVEDAISARLSAEVPTMLQFLNQVDAYGEVLYNPEVLKLAVARYEHLWLPLAAQSETALVAPLDIAFVWHCHMLSPLRCAAILHVSACPTSSTYHGTYVRAVPPRVRCNAACRCVSHV
jgi:hypothetical protein